MAKKVQKLKYEKGGLSKRSSALIKKSFNSGLDAFFKSSDLNAGIFKIGGSYWGLKKLSTGRQIRSYLADLTEVEKYMLECGSFRKWTFFKSD